MNKRRYVLKRKMQLRLLILFIMIGSFGAAAICLGLVNWIFSEYSRYGDDALAMGLINFIMGWFYIAPIICGADYCSRLWKKGMRLIKDHSKDMLK